VTSSRTRRANRSSVRDLPDDARVWIFGANRPLAAEEASRLDEKTARFLEGWAAHGEELAAAFDWRYDRFLIIALDERRAAASGCSIDALTGHVRQLESELGVDLVDGSPVWYRDDEEIRFASRREFGELAASGDVSGQTVVFDLTVGRLGELRAGRWELPASSSWHGQLLPPEAD
jgi:hypothetical protein